MSVFDRSLSIDDVAREAGVSRQTISNVLNHPHRVRPETRTLVEAVISKLGYRANAAARGLRTRKSSLIGVRLDSTQFRSSIQNDYLWHLSQAAENRGLGIIPFTASSKQDELAKIKSLVESDRVDGFALTETLAEDPRVEYLSRRGVPFLTFGRPWSSPNSFSSNHPWVDVDGKFGTRVATQTLLNCGFTNISFLTSNAINSGQFASVDKDRYEGWRGAMSENGMTDSKISNSVIIAPGEDVSDAKRSVVELLANAPAPQAVVCFSDALALGAHLALEESGKSAEIVGFDNSPIAEEFGFSSIDQRLEHVAAQSVSILMGSSGPIIKLRDFAAEGLAAHCLVSPALVPRGKLARLLDKKKLR